jgi:hypothetical protein
MHHLHFRLPFCFSNSASGAALTLYYPGQQGGEQQCHCD